MNWLNTIVDKLVTKHADEEIVVSSGVSPSGTYHMGTLREVLTAEAIYRELRRRGHKARHIHVVDDLDVLRKIPVDVDESFQEHLGKPLCDVPSPDGNGSYADYFLRDLIDAAKELKLEMEIVRAHKKYREGFYADVIEQTFAKLEEAKSIIVEISGRKLDPQWSPVQIVEDGRLKNREVLSLDTGNKQIIYRSAGGEETKVSYTDGQVKLNWRLDWPARWALLGVKAEPFGRDHATKGGSYDTGKELVKRVYDGEAPLPVPYDFINKTGENKKMSKSAGDTLTAVDLLKILPPELIWYFMLRFPPSKLLFFDTNETLIKLFDDFSALLAKDDKTTDDEQLLELCLSGIDSPTVSRVPFTHLQVSYQSSLRDKTKTGEVIKRTEYSGVASEDASIVNRELEFIENWLNNWADEDVVFTVRDEVKPTEFTPDQIEFFSKLADIIEKAPENADGEWYHKAVYELRDKVDMEPKQLFQSIYKLVIGRDSGPRAGWFLSTLGNEWLIDRLRLTK